MQAAWFSFEGHATRDRAGLSDLPAMLGMWSVDWSSVSHSSLTPSRRAVCVATCAHRASEPQCRRSGDGGWRARARWLAPSRWQARSRRRMRRAARLAKQRLAQVQVLFAAPAAVVGLERLSMVSARCPCEILAGLRGEGRASRRCDMCHAWACGGLEEHRSVAVHMNRWLPRVTAQPACKACASMRRRNAPQGRAMRQRRRSVAWAWLRTMFGLLRDHRRLGSTRKLAGRNSHKFLEIHV